MKRITGLLIAYLFPLMYTLFVHPILRNRLGEFHANVAGLSMMWIFSLLLFLHIIFTEKLDLKTYGFKPLSLKKILIAVGMGILLSMLIPLFYSLISLILDDPTGIENLKNQSSLIILAGILTAAVTEEFLFRAYPLEKLGDYKWLGIVSSILIFTAVHAQSWSLLHIFGIVLPLGIVLTFTYLKTRNVFFVMIVHFMIDLPLFIMSLMS